MSKRISETTIKQLAHDSYIIEKQEAMEVIMDDADSYFKQLTNLKSQILPGIYPPIYSLNLYPEFRERAVLEAMWQCRLKAKQDSNMLELKEKLIRKMTENLIKETTTKILTEGRIVHQVIE